MLQRQGGGSLGKQKLAQTQNSARPDCLELWINWNTKTRCTAAQTLQTTSSGRARAEIAS